MSETEAVAVRRRGGGTTRDTNTAYKIFIIRIDFSVLVVQVKKQVGHI
jgi:hypothetical protein